MSPSRSPATSSTTIDDVAPQPADRDPICVDDHVIYGSEFSHFEAIVIAVERGIALCRGARDADLRFHAPVTLLRHVKREST